MCSSCCCISLRGAVYFGTSIHIFVGLVLLVKWIVGTYLAAFSTHQLFTDTSFLLLTALSGVYLVIFLILGCLIFAGTEKQSVSLLKWSATGFTILQVLLFTVLLVLYLFSPVDDISGSKGLFPFLEPDSEEMRLLTIALYFCCLVATTNYIFVLLLYTHKLWRNKNKPVSSRGRDERSSSLTNLQISHPIPHHQVVATPAKTSTSMSRTTTPKPTTYYGQGQIHGSRTRRAPTVGGHEQESPGIYESLDANSHHFYPSNAYAGSYTSPRNQTPQQQLQPMPEESSYNGSASIRSNSGSGYYYHQRPNYYPYPQPHQRYREPLFPVSPATPGITSTARLQQIEDEREEMETPGQDWMGAYGHRLQVFQRGQGQQQDEIGNRNSGAGSMEPLLRQQQQQQYVA